MDIRPSWDEYFIEIMHSVGKRATCDRGKSGCIIVKNRQILATGYVGAPAGAKHCDEVGHEFVLTVDDGCASEHCIRTTHAEQNAICNAAKNGVSTIDSTLYCQMEPCYACAKMIINAGIIRVVAFKQYQKAERSREIFKECNVKLEVINPIPEDYYSVTMNRKTL